MIGLVLMVADLTLAGLVEGRYWQTHLPWTASIVALRKYWWVRLISAVPIVLGFVCFCFGILTGPLNEEGDAREEQAETTPSIVSDVRIGRWLETAYVARQLVAYLMVVDREERPFDTQMRVAGNAA